MENGTRRWEKPVQSHIESRASFGVLVQPRNDHRRGSPFVGRGEPRGPQNGPARQMSRLVERTAVGEGKRCLE
jgi:hypothetical protein